VWRSSGRTFYARLSARHSFGFSETSSLIKSGRQSRILPNFTNGSANLNSFAEWLKIRLFLVLLVALGGATPGGATPGGAGEVKYLGLLDDLVVYPEVLSQG
jgi:hypothetical protein